MDPTFWTSKKVFVTGHTGFKGSWLCLWLASMGAEVTGYALLPPTTPSLYKLAQIDSMVRSVNADIRDKDLLARTLTDADPDIVIHMAAQSLVRASYDAPALTFETNVMGTVNLLEAVKYAVTSGKKIKAVINVTSDKCYENKESIYGYRENDALGGKDPYSNSKACSELVTASYRNSFFHSDNYLHHGVALATVRAGNVIGGGDWAYERLIPDCIRAFLKEDVINIRNPHAVRPWQHVLEPLSGYLLLAQYLYEAGPSYAEGWNFGPEDEDAKSVRWVVDALCRKWGGIAGCKIDSNNHPHEAHLLKLDCTKAKMRLGWKPRWKLGQALDKVVEWSKAYKSGEDIRTVCLRQLNEFLFTVD
ncbi:CDP-glucose 4,6-dehydratase [Paenibacillus sp. Soil787]|uniref:CDP-glucose 4,6-dehydratase n=1 Tax=Paenibacillus sp. Soil787 TaxID=1736411 RepID=UPI000702EE58|nr:CDP-glucose 4,6-dehydratase [Paenibacillus sp. Soil787]